MVHNKIIIIGDAGRGKTTLASRLSEKLGINHYSTDDFYYEIKYTKPRDREDALNKIKKVFAGEKWIVEGTTQWLFEEGLGSSDIIIYLKYNNIFSQWFTLFKRHFERKDKSFKHTLYLMRHVFYKRYGLSYKKGKPTHTDIIAPYKDKVIVLDSFKKINDYINNITKQKI